MAVEEAPPLIIAERIKNNTDRQVIFLEADDAPHGQPRDEPGWDEGGEVKYEAKQYPGRKRKSYFGLYWMPAMRVFHGALRSHLDGRDYRKDRPADNTRIGRARALAELLELLGRRFSVCDVHWGDEKFVGVLVKASFKREGPEDYRYELGFDVDEVSGQETADASQTESPRTNQPLSDIIRELQAMMAEARARIAVARVEARVRAAVLLTLKTVDAGLEDAVSAARSLSTASVGTGRQFLALAQRFQSSCGNVQIAAKALGDQFSLLSADAGAFRDSVSGEVAPTAAETAEIASLQADTLAAVLYMRARLRIARAEASARVQPKQRTYRVQAGDTLESIASTQLGSRARGADLGVREQDLVPGSLIPLPEV